MLGTFADPKLHQYAHSVDGRTGIEAWLLSVRPINHFNLSLRFLRLKHVNRQARHSILFLTSRPQAQLVRSPSRRPVWAVSLRSDSPLSVSHAVSASRSVSLPFVHHCLSTRTGRLRFTHTSVSTQRSLPGLWLPNAKCHLTVRSQRSHVIAIARSTAVGPTLNKASLAPCPPP